MITQSCAAKQFGRSHKLAAKAWKKPFERLLERLDDDEDIDLVEEAMDVLTFTEDKEIFSLMDHGLDETWRFIG